MATVLMLLLLDYATLYHVAIIITVTPEQLANGKKMLVAL